MPNPKHYNDLTVYNGLRNQINSGDTILFSGRGFIPGLIEKITSSEYSHVGIAIWGLMPGSDDKERLFIIESTTLNNEKDISGEYRRGVQMLMLSQRLESYEGKAWLLPLTVPLTDEETLKACDWAFKQYTSKVKYDEVQAVKSIFDNVPKFLKWVVKPFLNQQDTSKLFCSELNTEFYKQAGRLPAAIVSAEQTPADIVKFAMFQNPPIELI